MIMRFLRAARTAAARVRPARLAVRTLALVLRERAAPLTIIRVARGLDPRPDSLLPRYSSSAPTGSALSHPQLAKHLADREFGHWSLGIDVIELLSKEIERSRPSLILEFGSGPSTASMAQFMVDLHGFGGRLRVISIEQDARFAADTKSLVERMGLSSYVEVVHAPLRRQVIEGVETNCYDIPITVKDLIQDEKVDLVVIDGPAAESGARFGTLPLVRSMVSESALFLLDDALRDSELDVAARWARLPYLKVGGILIVGKGVLRGNFKVAREAA
jgi:predicted O-methyltransferase YrrM